MPKIWGTQETPMLDVISDLLARKGYKVIEVLDCDRLLLKYTSACRLLGNLAEMPGKTCVLLPHFYPRDNDIVVAIESHWYFLCALYWLDPTIANSRESR